MRACSVLAIGAASFALFPAAAIAQTAPATATAGDPPGMERPAVSADPVENFLTRTSTQQRARANGFSRRGLASAEAQLRPLIATAQITPPGLGRNGAMRARLETALTTEVVQFLVSAGIGPGDVARSRARGIDLFEAGSAAIRGEATFAQQAALAPLVVVAEVTQSLQPSVGDGFGSSIGFRVVETLKGDAEPGTSLEYRQATGSEIDISTDLRPEVGDRFLLLLSRDYYEQIVAEAGGSPRSNAYAKLLPGFLVRGAETVPTVIGQPQLASLAAARAAVQP